MKLLIILLFEQDALQNELDELIKEEMDKQHLSTDIPVADLPKSNVVSYQHQYLVVKAEVLLLNRLFNNKKLIS